MDDLGDWAVRSLRLIGAGRKKVATEGLAD